MSFGINHNSNSQQQDTSQVASNLYNQGGTSTVAKTLDPSQMAAESQITQLIHALATNPQQFLAPAQSTARNQVNDNYTGLGDSLRQQFMANPGGGTSGKYGVAALQGDLARRKSLSDVDTGFAQTAAQLPVTAAGLSQQLLNVNMGQSGVTNNTGTSTSTATGHEEGSGSGTQFGGGVKLFGLG